MCQTKVCTNCKKSKNLESFGKSKRTSDNKQPQCKDCVNFKKRLLNSKRVISEQLPTDTKICSKCCISKLVTEFSNTSSTKDGKMYECKACRKKYHTPKIEGIKVFSDEKLKLCTKCKEIKDFSDFNKTLKNKTGVTSICKKCKVIDRKEVKTKDKNIPQLKTCTKCNVEKNRTSFVKDSSKMDGLSCVCKPCTNKHKVNRLNTDYTFRLATTMRKSITSSFKSCAKGIYSKNTKTETIIGTSFLELKTHIDCQLLNWMSWSDNYGKYNGEFNIGFDIDHIIPISYAKTEEDIYLLNHWSNFQPLCSKTNRDIKKAVIYPCTNLELGITFWEDRWEYTNLD